MRKVGEDDLVQEAGLDGFWVHRLLEANGVESHVVDAASIAVNRRHRRAKTDRIDVEALLHTLMAWARGERQVCSMVRPPSPEEEDARRLTRERATLVTERVRHVNRIKGLLAIQGVFDFEPIRKDRRTRVERLRRWDGQPLPPRLNTELVREVDQLELVMSQPPHRRTSKTPSCASSTRSSIASRFPSLRLTISSWMRAVKPEILVKDCDRFIAGESGGEPRERTDPH